MFCLLVDLMFNYFGFSLGLGLRDFGWWFGLLVGISVGGLGYCVCGVLVFAVIC